jgi:hypothetical protein
MMATPKERAEQRHQEKLDELKRQVDDGTLKIRKMTADERRANPPRPPAKRGRR